MGFERISGDARGGSGFLCQLAGAEQRRPLDIFDTFLSPS